MYNLWTNGFLKKVPCNGVTHRTVEGFPRRTNPEQNNEKKVRTMLVMTGNRVNKIFKSSITIMLPTDVVVLCCKSEEKRNKMPMLGF